MSYLSGAFIAFNHSSDVDYRDFMNPYRKCTAKPCSILVIIFHVLQIIMKTNH